MRVMLLTEQHLEFLSLKGGCTGSSESTLVKMTHCWKLHVAAQKSQGVSPFPTGDNKAAKNRQDSMPDTKHKLQKGSTNKAQP